MMALAGIKILDLTRVLAGEWQAILDVAGVPNGPVNSVDRVMENPQVIARDMIVEVEHPVADSLRMPGIPVKLSETPGAIRTPAPTLGQSTDEILRNLFGYTDAEIAVLRASGAL